MPGTHEPRLPPRPRPEAGSSLRRAAVAPMPKCSIRKMVCTRHAIPVAGIIVGYNAANTLGQVCLTRGIKVMTAGGDPTLAVRLLGIFVGTWLVGNLLEKIAEPSMNKWRQDAHNRFVKSTIEANRARVEVWSDTQQRDRLATMTGEQGAAALDQGIFQCTRLLVSGMAVAINLATLSTLLNPAIAATYLGAAVGAHYSLKWTEKFRIRLTVEETEARSQLQSHMQRLPENILSPNTYNCNLWQDEYNSLREKSDQSALASAKQQALNGVINTFIFAIPLTTGVAYSATSGAASLSANLSLAPAAST